MCHIILCQQQKTDKTRGSEKIGTFWFNITQFNNLILVNKTRNGFYDDINKAGSCNENL